jgi:hypothetical protein
MHELDADVHRQAAHSRQSAQAGAAPGSTMHTCSILLQIMPTTDS